MATSCCKYWILIMCIWPAIHTNEDVFAALEHLKLILRTEKELPKFLKLYFDLSLKIPEMESLAKPFLTSKFAHVENEEWFLSNPINVYLLVKRLTIEWAHLYSKLNPEILKRVHRKYSEEGNTIIFPAYEDLRAVARAFARLQQMYDLDISKVARGEIIPGSKSALELSADDCHELARQLNHQDEFTFAIPWLEASIARARVEKPKTVNIIDVLERFAFNSFQVGNFTRAFHLNEEILLRNPHHENANINYELYEKKAQTQKEYIIPPVVDPYMNFKVYKTLCKTEYIQNPKKEAKLKCYYSNNNSPLLLLQPIKVEDLHLQPSLTKFYDIMSDKDIRMIKKLAIPQLQKARVGPFQGEEDFKDYRVGKIAWLNDNISPTVAKISKRLEEITGLDVLNGAEELQVLNYGIGGHYDPHYDIDIVKYDSPPTSLSEPERIATILMYLSDVLKGGATVFPELGVAASPKKGAAVFWYNLLKTGKGDALTRHAACPVLLGNKWVSNKWILEYKQEFRRPCGLKESDIY